MQEHRGKKEQRSSRKCQCFACLAFRCAGVVVAKKPERGAKRLPEHLGLTQPVTERKIPKKGMT